MTTLYVPGDKSRAICPHCRKTEATTFAYRDVPFDDGSGTVKGVLTAVCDKCGAVAAIPAQSTPAIRRARETADIPLEINLPAPDIEILDAAAFQIDPQATARFRKAIFTYYLRQFERDPDHLEAVKRDLDKWTAARKQKREASGKEKIPSRRLSFKLAPGTGKRMTAVLNKTGWNKTSLVRSVIMSVEKDILKNRARKPVLDLQEIAAAVNA
jgi:hypothetical protein